MKMAAIDSTHNTCPVCMKIHPGSICLPPPTKDQEEYLRKIQDATGKYDPNVMVGPPSKRRSK